MIRQEFPGYKDGYTITDGVKIGLWAISIGKVEVGKAGSAFILQPGLWFVVGLVFTKK